MFSFHPCAVSICLPNTSCNSRWTICQRLMAATSSHAILSALCLSYVRTRTKAQADQFAFTAFSPILSSGSPWTLLPALICAFCFQNESSLWKACISDQHHGEPIVGVCVIITSHSSGVTAESKNYGMHLLHLHEMMTSFRLNVR